MNSDLSICVGALFAAKLAELETDPRFVALIDGTAAIRDYERFLENVARTHLRSPQLVAFLYALAPPAARDHLLDNVLEELGLDGPAPGERGVAHPVLLRELLINAGLGARLPALEAEADQELRRVVMEPLVFGTLRDVGLAALGEIVAFEYMLSRTAGSVARALTTHLGLGLPALAWFTHHAEVDRAHADQGMAAVLAYVGYYHMPQEDALTLLELALRPNPFLKRYFAPQGGSGILAEGRRTGAGARS
ncbi:MAG TPA: iron-containing redox enzyme family protein [Solirubrobacterales bacterium]|nr:iron-containing redox enzyme family protein [Solirubrobacterales bacterium]